MSGQAGDGLDPDRIAELIVTTFAGKKRRGSGYRVTSTAVLTAAHVVADAANVKVRFDVDRPGQWEALATVAWSHANIDDGVAVLTFTAPPGVATVTPVRFGRIPDDRHALVNVHAAGFPLWKQRQRGDAVFRELHQADGTVGVLSNPRTGTLEITVQVPPADPEPQVSPWAGMSGAAVWVGHHIVGVVAEHYRREGAGRLTAIRIERVFSQVGESDNRWFMDYLGIADPATLPDAVSDSDGMGWPRVVGVVPPEADCYQPRLGISRRVAATVDGGGTAVLCQVVSGMGGVGKTQLAAGYARTVADTGSADLVVWITARSRSEIMDGYAQATAVVSNVDVSDAEQAAVRFLTWLTNSGRHWLVVLDDVAEPGDLRGLWPPTVPNGQTVVTTRRRDAAFTSAGRVLVDVGLFTPVEAAAYLAAKLSDEPERLSEAEALAADLGYLPLALAQAAAYILDRDLTCAQYRSRLAGQKKTLAELMPEDGALPDDHRTTVAATWSLSIDAADRLTPTGLARPVLHLAALLDPNGIPTAVFLTPAVTDWLATASGRPIDTDDAHDALHNLHRLNLVTLTQNTVRIHALVQRAVRDTTDSAASVELARAAADAIHQIWPDINRDTALLAVLRTNVIALRDHAEAALWHPDTGGHPALFAAGASLGDSGQVAAAFDYYQQSSIMANRRLGSDHPDTLIIRHNLAYSQGEVGDPAGAVVAFEGLLVDCLRVLGPDHPHTLRARGNLARWRGEAGDPAGAVVALEGLLADRLRILGRDHPRTLVTRHNLAYWRGVSGDPVGAVVAFEGLLVDCLRVLGPDHLRTLRARGNLARWRGDAGDPAGAVVAFEGLLVDCLRVLGPDYPHTLIVRHNLAYWRGVSGDPAGAVVAFEGLLVDCLRVLGPDHLRTLRVRANLARWRGDAGDPVGAVVALEELLTDRLRVLGPDHPHTLIVRHNLAYWQGVAGGPVNAVDTTELLADCMRVLGPEHPDTLAARRSIAHVRGVAGDPAGAVVALEELLADCMRVLGPEHPVALVARHGLAYWQGVLKARPTNNCA